MQSLWMLVACAMFALMGAGVKFSADFEANLAQIIFLRGLPSVIILFVWTRLQKRSLVPLSWGLHIKRNVFGISAMWLSRSEERRVGKECRGLRWHIKE